MKRLFFLLVLSFGIFTSAVFAGERSSDVILLIDVSGSMLYSDENRAMPESVNGLIDKIAEDGGRVGIVTFSGTLKYILPVSDLSDEDERNSVKLRISRSVYNGYTDIGQVMLKSTELLNEQETLNSPMVLLFTDGMIEINPNTARRTAEQSYGDTLTALSSLIGQASVYSVGLDDGDRVDRELLELISGENNTFITTDAARLPELFQAAYEAHVNPAYSNEEETSPSPSDNTADAQSPTPSPLAEAPSFTPLQTTDASIEPTASPITDDAAQDQNHEEPLDESLSDDSPLDESPLDESLSDESPPDSNPTDASISSPSQEENSSDNRPWRPGPAILVSLVVLVLAAVIISARWLLRLAKSTGNSSDFSDSASFDITVSAPLGGEKVPTVSLEAEIGDEGLDLSELVQAAINGQSLLNVNTDGLSIFIKRRAGRPALLLTGKAKCEISDSTNTILDQKKIWWKESERLTFINPDMTKLEITYIK